MIIKVLVKPGSKENRIVQLTDQTVVYVKAPAENNKANKALLKMLAKHFKKQVRIKSGFSSKQKFVEILE